MPRECRVKRTTLVTYAPEDQQRVTKADEWDSIGAASRNGRWFFRWYRTPVRPRVSDIWADSCSHSHRSFTFPHAQARTTAARCDCCRRQLRSRSPSDTNTRWLGRRLGYSCCHVNLSCLAGARQRQSRRLRFRHCNGCSRNKSLVLCVSSRYRNRAWDPGGLANKLRSGFGSDRGGRSQGGST